MTLDVQTIKLERPNPYLDDTFVHFFGECLVDTGHPSQWKTLSEQIDPEKVTTILLTSSDQFSTGNISRFPHAKIFGLPIDESVSFRHIEKEPGVEQLIGLIRPPEEFKNGEAYEGDVVEVEYASFDLISFPVPDRSGAMWHEPDLNVTFVGAMPSGTWPMWCADAEDFSIACQRLDSVELGRVFSRATAPQEDGQWFKKRMQRFSEHFASTLGQQNPDGDLRAFIERDFGGMPDDELEWGAAVLRYSPFI